MKLSTVIDGDTAERDPPEEERAAAKPFLLGVAISGVLWAILGLATTVTVSAPLVPELPNISLAE